MIHIIIFDDDTQEYFRCIHQKEKLLSSGRERLDLHRKIARLEKQLFDIIKAQSKDYLKARWKEGIKKANEGRKNETH